MLNNLTWAIVDAAATELGVSGATRRAWHRPERKVPFEWRIKITELLRARGMMVAFSDFEQLP